MEKDYILEIQMPQGKKYSKAYQAICRVRNAYDEQHNTQLAYGVGSQTRVFFPSEKEAQIFQIGILAECLESKIIAPKE